jgi:hypothetical protein
MLTVTVAALVLLSPSTVAAGACCDQHKCTRATCCKHHSGEVALDPAEVGLTVITPGLEWPETEPRPTRELAKVLFRDPVKIGDRVLIGPYVIEHDNARMARGLPCTHIYAANDMRMPVVAFHCRHLDRKTNPKATVTLERLPDPTIRIFKLVEYQFQGSADGHGVPTER